jgi:hypothetical protein
MRASGTEQMQLIAIRYLGTDVAAAPAGGGANSGAEEVAAAELTAAGVLDADQDIRLHGVTGTFCEQNE